MNNLKMKSKSKKKVADKSLKNILELYAKYKSFRNQVPPKVEKRKSRELTLDQKLGIINPFYVNTDTIQYGTSK